MSKLAVLLGRHFKQTQPAAAAGVPCALREQPEAPETAAECDSVVGRASAGARGEETVADDTAQSPASTKAKTPVRDPLQLRARA